jgi:large subunit ribosomal protein L10
VNREQKAATIEALTVEIERSQAVFAVDYRGISVPQAAELRSKLRDADASFRVVKNSLTERAAEQAGAQDLKTMLSGPTALTFVRGDAAIAAKAIADYARATQLLPFKGGLMDGGVLDASQILAISRLPSREVLYGQLVGVVASPVSGLVRTLGALVGGLAVALGQVRDKKQSGEISAGEEPSAQQAEEPVSEPAIAQEAGAAATEDAPAQEAEAASEGASAQQAEEPASEPAQENDNQADASEQQTGDAEATKED